MATRQFAFNSGTTISGSMQIKNIAISSEQMDYSGSPGVGGVQWWSGPDETNKYIICVKTLKSVTSFNEAR